MQARYRADLIDLLRPTADLNDHLAHLDLPPQRARHVWRALRAAEAATPVIPPSSEEKT